MVPDIEWYESEKEKREKGLSRLLRQVDYARHASMLIMSSLVDAICEMMVYVHGMPLAS